MKAIFKSKCRLNTLFWFKEIFSGITYLYTCSNCKCSNRYFYIRAAEHMGISNLTGKYLKSLKQSAISDHLLQCNCTINFVQITSNGDFVNKTWQISFKQTINRFHDNNFISDITGLSDFLLIYNSNFILCTDKARICFKCYVKQKRKCSFENAPVEKSRSSTNL